MSYRSPPAATQRDEKGRSIMFQFESEAGGCPKSVLLVIRRFIEGKIAANRSEWDPPVSVKVAAIFRVMPGPQLPTSRWIVIVFASQFAFGYRIPSPPLPFVPSTSNPSSRLSMLFVRTFRYKISEAAVLRAYDLVSSLEDRGLMSHDHLLD
jgi:hypothetical protein